MAREDRKNKMKLIFVEEISLSITKNILSPYISHQLQKTNGSTLIEETQVLKVTLSGRSEMDTQSLAPSCLHSPYFMGL